MTAPDKEREQLGLAWAPEWADAWGEDEHGAFASFMIDRVTQRMRWIPPGTFMMGSPSDEPGRFDDEGPQHLVTLTAGFWMADTPCTQALWQTVMGENPSEFVSPRRPVERVSWNDAREFIERLNARRPGLSVGLPTEAQWEYACRAGTKTATYAGPMQILGEHHAPVLDAIAWYGGNSGHEFDLDDGWDSTDWPEKQYPHVRAGTREVGLKGTNRWGLFDMLGNVYEWCADGNRDYEQSAIVDPTGPSGRSRVFRGGSWIYDARAVRAAARYWYEPDDRLGDLGFRLIRGQ